MGEYCLFFELLQVAIGNKSILSRVPTVQEWGELYNMATRQALTGVCFVGLQRLKSTGEEAVPEVLYLKWLGMAAKIQQRNQVVNSACAELVKQYTHDGLSCCILKGQGNLVNYKTPSNSPCLGGGTDDTDLGMYRTPGDIDVWCTPADPCGIEIAVGDLDGKGAHYEKYHGKQAVIEYVKMLHRIKDAETTQRCQTLAPALSKVEGCKKREPEVRYHHIDAPAVGGVEVEVHFRPLFLDSPLRNWRLQRWFRENEQFGVCDFAVGGDKTKTGKNPSYDGKKQDINLSAEELDKKALTSSEAPSSPLAYNACDSACECDSQTASQTSSATLSGDDEAKEKKSFGKKALLESGKKTIPVPTASFNAVYQLCHIYRHLFDEGVGLRQLLDYYFVLRALHIEQGSFADRTQSMAQWAEGMGVAVKSNEEIMHTLSRFGMKKFASAVMYVLQTVFAMPDEYLLCPPNEEEGRFLLNEIMLAGNFGKYDERIKRETPSIPLRGKKVPGQLWHAFEKTKHNMRLLTHYPEEVLWEPAFRLYHYLWRKLELWRF